MKTQIPWYKRRMELTFRNFVIPIVIAIILFSAPFFHNPPGMFIFALGLFGGWVTWLCYKSSGVALLLAAVMLSLSVGPVHAQSSPPKQQHQDSSIGIIVGVVATGIALYLVYRLGVWANQRLNPPKPPPDGGTNQPPSNAVE